MIIRFIKKEIEAFDIFSSDAKKLLTIDLVFAIAFPFIIIFGSAFVLRITGGNNTMAIVYNWGFFAGLTVGFFITGMLLKNRIDIRIIFSVGMLLTVIPLSILMFIGKDSGYYVILYGLFVGTGNGLYWSCRNVVACQTTNDNNRNFFTSVEQFMIIFCNALVPLLFGTFILGHNPSEEYKLIAYKYTSVLVVAITLFAAFLIMKSNFKTPVINKFVYFKFGRNWNLQRLLTLTIGMVEAGFMVIMTLLILNIAGDESVLGKIEFTAAIISVIAIYIVGRIAKPKHRGKIMLAGAISLFAGGIVLAFTIGSSNEILGFVAVSFLGVIAIKAGQVIADPLIHTAYRATYLTSIEKSSKSEDRDSYTYIMDNEYFKNGGRIVAGAVFLIISRLIDDTGALGYIFPILAFILLISAYLIKKLTTIKINSAITKMEN